MAGSVMDLKCGWEEMDRSLRRREIEAVCSDTDSDGRWSQADWVDNMFGVPT